MEVTLVGFVCLCDVDGFEITKELQDETSGNFVSLCKDYIPISGQLEYEMKSTEKQTPQKLRCQDCIVGKGK